MKHDPFSLTELIRNDDFIAWVRHPDESGEARWRDFLVQNPEKRKIVEAARGYVILLAEDTGKNKPTIEQSNKMWRAVESHLHEENVEETKHERIVSHWRWLRVAASIVLILGIASVSYWYFTKQPGIGEEVGIINADKNSSDNLVIKANGTTKPMTILLTDGSSVVLQPGGQLGYPEKMDAKSRKVTLIGKAFFEIVPDSKRPFLVYTGGIVTKVLGTSFLVDAPENSEEVKVEVKTGKVSVFALSNNPSSTEQEEANKPELRGIILNHNQKIAVSRQSGKPVKVPEVIAEPKDAQNIYNQLFVFDETPVSEVFGSLESAYNVRIVYDKTLMGNCPLNATLIGQPFNEKLTVICAALDAQFEIKKDQVFITGQGCK